MKRFRNLGLVLFLLFALVSPAGASSTPDVDAFVILTKTCSSSFDDGKFPAMILGPDCTLRVVDHGHFKAEHVQFSFENNGNCDVSQTGTKVKFGPLCRFWVDSKNKVHYEEILTHQTREMIITLGIFGPIFLLAVGGIIWHNRRY